MITKLMNAARWILLLRGATRIKAFIWNREFAKGRWNCLDDTSGDCVYEYVEKYSNQGCILDLGCGSGNTGCELDVTRYNFYTGIDISGVAIQAAIDRAKAGKRSKKNEYYEADIFKYIPHQKYSVILFRDSIYYFTPSAIRPLLDRYAPYLEDNGVFIVRMFDRENGRQYVDLIKDHYKVVEQYLPTATNTIVLVFR